MWRRAMPALNLDVIPDPQGLTWGDWSDTLVGYNPDLRAVVDPTEDWQEFARRFNEAAHDAPMPIGFSSWQDWAVAVKLVFGR
jgi:hypothetical protein